jgi:bifunctional non-homologous end joining protein LigD
VATEGKVDVLDARAILTAVSRASAPPDVQPMQPVLTKPFHRDGWVYEEKYDGWRIVAYKDGRHVRLVSRRGVDHTERFADIAAAVRCLPARTLILDGEVCVFDDAVVSHMLDNASERDHVANIGEWTNGTLAY